MPNLFNLLSEYFWLAAIVVGGINYLVAVRRLHASTSISPDRIPEAQVFLQRIAIAGCVPWIIMGVGYLQGATPNVWYYFRPQDGNPFVLGWHAIVFAMACANAWWILFGGGAKKLADLNLMAVIGNESSQSESSIRLFAAGGPIFAALAIVVLFWIDAPLPKS